MSKPNYFTPCLAEFVAKQCTFSVAFNHVFINCQSNKDYAHLIRNRNQILCMWATALFSKENGEIIRHSFSTIDGLENKDNPWIIKVYG